ncbi:vesicular inhibitory amino acid transporter [Polypterus senegalus]
MNYLGTPASLIRVLKITKFGFAEDSDEESLSFALRDTLDGTYRQDEEDPDGHVEDGSGQLSEEPPVPSLEIASARITSWEAGWNVTNAIQGIFVLGLPYALLNSGYLGFFLIILAAMICCYTGNILIACLYEEDDEGRPVRVRNTYEDIANACCKHSFPRLGGRLVNMAQIVELMMTCILYLVVSGNLMYHSFPSLPVSQASWSVIAFFILLPCLLIKDLRIVSKLSLLCSLAQFIITFIVIGYCLTHITLMSWRRITFYGNYEKFLESVGVIIFSYTSQIFLPTLEGKMVHQENFVSMMTWTHLIACIFKTAFAVLGFLTWGEETKEVITDNLPSALRTVVNVCLLVKVLLSYPLPFYAATEILQTCICALDLEHSRKQTYSLVMRGSLLLVTFLVSLYIPHFSLLMGLTGSMTGAAMSFLLPALFHLKLKWRSLACKEKVLDLSIVVLGTLCSLSGLICSVMALIEAFGKR